MTLLKNDGQTLPMVQGTPKVYLENIDSAVTAQDTAVPYDIERPLFAYGFGMKYK